MRRTHPGFWSFNRQVTGKRSVRAHVREGVINGQMKHINRTRRIVIAKVL